MTQSSPFLGYEGVLLGNGDKISIAHVGSSHLFVFNGCILSLDNVLHTPNAAINLVSINKTFTENSFSAKFDLFCFLWHGFDFQWDETS